MKEIERIRYLKELDAWKDRTNVVKVILGARRSGKSVVMQQYARRIVSAGIDPSRILDIDFESADYDVIADYRDLNSYIASKIPRDERCYVFLDEIQRIDGWERSVNSLMVDYNADIYITGSNAYILSSELSTYLSGRYVEIPIFPFSFSEFLEAHPATPELSLRSRFEQYLRVGGIPLTDPDESGMHNSMILEGIYSTIILKDVARRTSIRDTSGLDRVARFLMDNAGNVTNVDNIARIAGMTKKTVNSYIHSMTEAFLLYKVDRYDVVGKKLLSTHEKYYPVDTGLAKAVLNGRSTDLSRPLESVVFVELLRRGYRVRVGSFRDREVDFIAHKEGKVVYYQVCLTMLNDDVFNREVRSLKAIDDNYPKIILSLDEIVRDAPDGLIHRNVIEWLLDNEFRSFVRSGRPYIACGPGAPLGLLHQPLPTHGLQEIGGLDQDLLLGQLLRVPGGQDACYIRPGHGAVPLHERDDRILVGPYHEGGQQILTRPGCYTGHPVHYLHQVPADQGPDPALGDVTELRQPVQVHDRPQVEVAAGVEDAGVRPSPDPREANGHTVVRDVEIWHREPAGRLGHVHRFYPRARCRDGADPRHRCY